MRNRRNDKGFTMMEMLVAVAILVILMGVAFLAVINYQRTMKRLELDKTAREIFVAAQNHLTMAQSQGLLEDLDSDDRGYHGEGAGADEYCLFVNGPDDYEYESTATILHLMLPPFSLDDTVRSGGSYAIRYNWKTATVRDVFYSDHSNMSNATFSSADYAKLFTSPRYDGDEAAKSQLRLDGYDGDRNKILGWYGGADLRKAQVDELVAPSIKIRNAEKLEVMLKLANLNIANTKIQLIMHGDTSGVDKLVKEFDISDFADDLTNRTATVCLDDITTAKGHFAEQEWCKGGEGKSIIPGENITLYARIYSNTELVKEATSARKHTNSLFGRIVDEKQAGLDPANPNIVKTATISNIRHLENLYGAVSGYDPSKVGKDGEDGATAARQTSDLRWKGSAKGFCEVIAEKDGKNANQVKVYLNGETTEPAKQTFVPVSPEYALTYYGQNLSVSGVAVDVSDAAGLFGKLLDKSSVQDLELVDCSVNTSADNAGALVGEAAGAIKLTNVVVHDSSGTVKSAIRAKTNAGGLLGKASNGTVKIDSCAASVFVNATGSGSVAGGLIGSASGNVTVEKCYAGGHTTNGTYVADAINVTAIANAGGLIGSANGVDVSHSYATTSVSGGNNVGGLVGSVAGGSIEKSYCTGLVVAREGATDAKLGAFAGAVSGVTLKNKDCKFFSIINEGMSAVPDATDPGVEAFDKTAKTYQAFFKGTEPAKPYDKTLADYYQNKYAFQTVKRLGGENVTGFVKTHYGDWPAPEVLVRNEKATS